MNNRPLHEEEVKYPPAKDRQFPRFTRHAVFSTRYSRVIPVRNLADSPEGRLYAVFYILYSVFLCHRKSFMKFSLTILIIPAVFLILTACNNHSAARVTDAKADSILHTAAIFPFTDSIKQFPDSPRYYFARGSLLYSIRQYGLSKLDLEKAIWLNPHEPAYYYGLGEVNMAAGKPSLARNNFEQALALNPKNVQVRLELASALFQLGNYPLALSELDTLL